MLISPILNCRLNTQPPAKPARNSIAQRINVFNHNQAQDTAIPLAKQSESVDKKQVVIEPAAVVETPAVSANEANSIASITEEDAQQSEDLPLAHESEQFSTIKRSPHSKTNSVQSQSPDETTSSNETDTAVFKEEEEVRTKVSVTVQQSQSVKTSGLSTLERNARKFFDYLCLNVCYLMLINLQ